MVIDVCRSEATQFGFAISWSNTKTYEEIETDEERWLYLLKHAGKADSLPDFGDPVIAKAIERLLVKNVSEKSLKEQASDR